MRAVPSPDGRNMQDMRVPCAKAPNRFHIQIGVQLGQHLPPASLRLRYSDKNNVFDFPTIHQVIPERCVLSRAQE